MVQKDMVRIGLIGCGNVSRGHIRRLLKIPRAEIVGLSDVDESKTKTLMEDFPEVSACRTFSDYHDMIDVMDLDAVEVLTPHTLHFSHVMDALEAGLHVLVEKPMVCSSIDAAKLVDKAEKENRVVLVSYQRRYQSRFRYIKNVISSGDLGTVQFISALQGQAWLTGQQGRWRLDPKLSGGGQLMDSGSHLLDVILWLIGAVPTSVFASIEKFDTQLDINSILSIRFSNGAQASISVVGNSPCKGMREDITIWGTNGMIFHRNEKEGGIQLVSPDGEKCEPTDLPPESTPDLNFVNVIQGLEENMSLPKDSIRVIQVVEKAWESATTGRIVKI